MPTGRLCSPALFGGWSKRVSLAAARLGGQGQVCRPGAAAPAAQVSQAGASERPVEASIGPGVQRRMLAACSIVVDPRQPLVCVALCTGPGRRVAVIPEGAAQPEALLGTIRLVAWLARDSELAGRECHLVVDSGTGATATGARVGGPASQRRRCLGRLGGLPPLCLGRLELCMRLRFCGCLHVDPGACMCTHLQAVVGAVHPYFASPCMQGSRWAPCSVACPGGLQASCWRAAQSIMPSNSGRW